MKRSIAKKVKTSGFIYLVEAVKTGKFKVGKTNNVQERIRALQTGCPIPIRYVHAVFVEDVDGVERDIHKFLSAYRAIGEWFDLDNELISVVVQGMNLNHDANLLLEVTSKTDKTSDTLKILMEDNSEEDAGNQQWLAIKQFSAVDIDLDTTLTPEAIDVLIQCLRRPEINTARDFQRFGTVLRQMSMDKVKRALINLSVIGYGFTENEHASSSACKFFIDDNCSQAIIYRLWRNHRENEGGVE